MIILRLYDQCCKRGQWREAMSRNVSKCQGKGWCSLIGDGLNIVREHRTQWGFLVLIDIPPSVPFSRVFVGNGPNTVSGSTVSNTELSEFFWDSLSSRERTQWVPFSLLFVCQNELTEFFAELTEFAPKLSEAQWVLFSETVLSKQYSARFLIRSVSILQP